MEGITDYFIRVLEEHRSVDIAEAEFKRAIGEDEDLHVAYRQWCDEVGSSEKTGFRDFCGDYLSERNSIWDTLSDYNE